MPSEWTIAFVSNPQQIDALDDLSRQEGRTRSSMIRNLIDIGLAYYKRVSPPTERAVRVLTDEVVAQSLAQALRDERTAPVPAGAADADTEA